MLFPPGSHVKSLTTAQHRFILCGHFFSFYLPHNTCIEHFVAASLFISNVLENNWNNQMRILLCKKCGQYLMNAWQVHTKRHPWGCLSKKWSCGGCYGGFTSWASVHIYKVKDMGDYRNWHQWSSYKHPQFFFYVLFSDSSIQRQRTNIHYSKWNKDYFLYPGRGVCVCLCVRACVCAFLYFLPLQLPLMWSFLT